MSGAEHAEQVDVESSVIRSIAYTGAEIIVAFHSGASYAYQAPRAIYEQFLAADSKGRFLNERLKSYPARKLN